MPVSGELSLNAASPYLYGQVASAIGTISGSWVDPTVSIFTQVGTNPKQLVGTGGVDSAGRFAVQVPVRASETFILEWSDGEQSGTDSKAVTVEPVAISIRLDHVGAPYNYGQSAKVTVLLLGAFNRTFKLYKRIGSGSRQLVTTARVSASTRNVVVLVPVRSKTSFVAEWVDGAKKATSVAKTAYVAAHVAVSMYGYSRLSSGDALYRAGTSMGIRAAILVPHSGGCIVYAVQVYSGGWKDLAYHHCVYTNSYGVTHVAFPYDRHLRGHRLRFNAYFKGDSTNTRATSNWAYARWPS